MRLSHTHTHTHTHTQIVSRSLVACALSLVPCCRTRIQLRWGHSSAYSGRRHQRGLGCCMVPRAPCQQCPVQLAANRTPAAVIFIFFFFFIIIGLIGPTEVSLSCWCCLHRSCSHNSPQNSSQRHNFRLEHYRLSADKAAGVHVELRLLIGCNQPV